MAYFFVTRPIGAVLGGALLLAWSAGLVPVMAAGCEDHKNAADQCEREGVFACNPPVGGKCYTTHVLTKFNCECLTKRPPDVRDPELPRETAPRPEPEPGRPLAPLNR